MRIINFLIFVVALNFCVSAINFVDRVNTDNDKRALSYLRDAKSLAVTDFEASLAGLKKVLELPIDTKELKEEILYDVYNTMAFIYVQKEDLENLSYVLDAIDEKSFGKKKYLSALRWKASDYFLNKKDYANSEKIHHQFNTSEFKPQVSYFFLGYIYLIQKKYQEAINYFLKAGDKSYFLDTYYFFKSLVLYRLGRYGDALNDSGSSFGALKDFGYPNIIAILCSYQLGWKQNAKRFFDDLKGKCRNFDIKFLIRAREQEILEGLLPDLKEIENKLIDEKFITEEDRFSPYIESKEWLNTPLKTSMGQQSVLANKR